MLAQRACPELRRACPERSRRISAGSVCPESPSAIGATLRGASTRILLESWGKYIPRLNLHLQNLIHWLHMDQSSRRLIQKIDDQRWPRTVQERIQPRGHRIYAEFLKMISAPQYAYAFLVALFA